VTTTARLVRSATDVSSASLARCSNSMVMSRTNAMVRLCPPASTRDSDSAARIRLPSLRSIVISESCAWVASPPFI
jgi:hypothetical protein